MNPPVSLRPAIRARWTQAVLRGIDDRLADDELYKVRQRLHPEKVATIEGLDTFDWLDIDTHIHLLDALYWGMGKARYVAYYRETARKLYGSRFLRAVAVAGARVFGRAALVRAFPRGWGLVVRDCGVLRVERDEVDGVTRLTLEDIPPVVARSDAIRLAIAASLAAALDIAGYIGKVEVDPGPVRDRTFEFRVSLIVDPPA